MPAKIVDPELGESVLEATVGHWQKNEGDRVTVGEVLVSLETDKVDLEVGAERDGVLAKIERREGEDVKIGDVLGVIEDGGGAAEDKSTGETAKRAAPSSSQPQKQVAREEQSSVTPAVSAAAAESAAASKPPATPSARRLARERGIHLEKLVPSNGGRLTKADVERHRAQSSKPEPAAAPVPTALPAALQRQPA